MSGERKVLLLTGANGGITRAVARLFHQLGASLVLSDLNEAGLRGFGAELDPTGGRVVTLKGDAEGFERDVKRRQQLGALAVQQLTARGGPTLDEWIEQRWAPRCIHTQPTVATVGWTEEEAASKGIEFAIASDSMRLASDDERSVVDPEPTFVKAIFDSRTRNLLGCLVVGDHAAVIAK